MISFKIISIILVDFYIFSLSNETCIVQTKKAICSLVDLGNIDCPESLIVQCETFGILKKSKLKGCENTVNLRFGKCLNYIEEDSFSGMNSLTGLIFDDNILSEINNKWLSGLANLDVLYFINCSIVDIESNAFANLSRLESLHLERNKLTRINYGIFTDLNIKKLALSGNQISHIEKDAFENLESLKELSLDDNHLRTFVSGDVLKNSMKNLEILWLHRNLLSQLTGVMFEGLEKLRVLNVMKNQISIIEPYTFENTPNLVVLILNDNVLTKLESTVFPRTGLPKLQLLYINNNRLTYLKSSLMHRLRNLKRIVIGGNPWQCKCLDFILKWLNENQIGIDNCDKDYFLDGTRPACVVEIGANSDGCTYEDDSYFYLTYSQEINNYPELNFCY